LLSLSFFLLVFDCVSKFFFDLDLNLFFFLSFSVRTAVLRVRDISTLYNGYLYSKFKKV